MKCFFLVYKLVTEVQSAVSWAFVEFYLFVLCVGGEREREMERESVSGVVVTDKLNPISKI